MKRFAFLFFALLSSYSYAAGQWSGSLKVKNLYVHGGTNGLYVRLDSTVVTNPGACASTDWYYMGIDNPRFQEIFSLLLAAKKSQDAVSLYIDGCGDQRPKIIAVQE